LQRFSRKLQPYLVIPLIIQDESVKVFSTDGAVFEIFKKNCVRKNPLSLLKYEEPLGNRNDNRDKQAM